MVEKTDRELVESAQHELPYRHLSFSLLMQRYERRVLQSCYRLLQNRQDAEDAYQEILIRVFFGLKQFRREASFATWLFRICHNACVNALRDRRRRAAADTVELDPNAPLQAVWDSTETEIDVERAFARLPFPDREILILRYSGDLTIDEISRILDLSLSAAKMRLYRARDKFMSSLESRETRRDPGRGE